MNKKTIVVLAVIVLAILAGWQLFHAYTEWRANRSLARARDYVRQGKYNEAMLSIESGLDTNGSLPEAYRAMAEALEACGSPAALPYREKAARLLANNPQAGLDLARCALQFNRLEIAREALGRIPDSERESVTFLEIQSLYLAAAGNPSGAAAAYAKIVDLFPETHPAKEAALNLVKIWLTDGIAEEPWPAVRQVQELAGDPEFGTASLHLMVGRAMKKADIPAAFLLSCQLSKTPKAEIGEHLQMLDLMQAVQCPLAAAALAWTEDSAKDDPSKAAKMGAWLIKEKGPMAALEWLNRLPESELQVKPLPIVLADCYSRLKDWAALEKLLTGKDWGSLNAQRNAMLANAYRHQQKDDLADLAWKAALSAGRNQPGSLTSLSQLAISEQRMDEGIDALWNIPASDPGYLAAEKQLFIHYRLKNDAAGLLRLMERTLAAQPDNPAVKLNVATLLLVTGLQPTRALRLARDVYQANPRPVRHAAVYAYSLYLANPGEQGAAKAASILDARTGEEKSSNECLVYYGLILTGCKRYDEALHCFQKMNPKLLFPEMLEKAGAAEAECRAHAGRG